MIGFLSRKHWRGVFFFSLNIRKVEHTVLECGTNGVVSFLTEFYACHVYECFACLYVVPCVCLVPQRPEEDIMAPGTWSYRWLWVAMWVQRIELGPLQEQWMFLIWAVSLYPVSGNLNCRTEDTSWWLDYRLALLFQEIWLIIGKTKYRLWIYLHMNILLKIRLKLKKK